ncbi:MAG: HU family DNA-binding protein [Thermodesulfobacteriota bacterium]|nr:HU family DNA-binding protein [Thermodesulfobacteriota bacterium]
MRELTDGVFQKAPEVFPTKRTAKKAVKAMGEVVFDLLSRGVDVKLHGIGSLKIHERTARKGRNPSTGEALEIPAKKGLKFFPSRALREKMNP